MSIMIVDVATGQIDERERTESEQTQYETDQAAFTLASKEELENKVTQQANREAAIAHAKTLGFTDAMIAVMYPNLGA